MAEPARQYDYDSELENDSDSFGLPANDNYSSQPGEIDQSFSPEQLITPNPQPANENAQLSAQQQADAAADMQGFKQRQLAQIAQQEAQLTKELNELEGNLTDFRKKTGTLSLLRFFQPRITFVIEELVAELKKTSKNLADEPKMKTLEKLIGTINALIGILTGAKLLAVILDVLIFLLRIILFTLPTIFIPIVILVLSPLYAPFLAIFYFIGMFPFFKGRITQQIIKLIADLKKQKQSWEKQVKILREKVNIRKQLAKLEAAKKQLPSRFSLSSR